MQALETVLLIAQEDSMQEPRAIEGLCELSPKSGQYFGQSLAARTLWQPGRISRNLDVFRFIPSNN